RAACSAGVEQTRFLLLAKFEPGDTFPNPMTDSVISSHARGSARAQDATGRAASTRLDHRGLGAALLGALLMIGAGRSEAQSPVKQVLVLQTFDRGNLVLDHFTGEFRLGLDQPVGRPLNVVQVVVGPRGFVGAPEQAIVDYISSMFADRPAPDLIVTVGGPAAVFARGHRRQLFPETPLLFGAVDERWFRGAPLGENESAVAVANDFPRLIDDILQVLPETRQVFMVAGSGPIGRFWQKELETGFARFRDR